MEKEAAKAAKAAAMAEAAAAKKAFIIAHPRLKASPKNAKKVLPKTAENRLLEQAGAAAAAARGTVLTGLGGGGSAGPASHKVGGGQKVRVVWPRNLHLLTPPSCATVCPLSVPGSIEHHSNNCVHDTIISRSVTVSAPDPTHTLTRPSPIPCRERTKLKRGHLVRLRHHLK
jgi:hypothetical protein